MHRDRIVYTANKAFFFINYEKFRQPSQVNRTRAIMNPLTQTGVFRYNITSGGVTSVREVNLLSLAAANGQTSTIDPVIGKLLSDIRAATATVGRRFPIERSQPAALQLQPHRHEHHQKADGSV